MLNPVLEAENLHLHYGTQKVLNRVSFQMQQGKILALIGPNGAGKSSAMRILAGLVRPEDGEILIHGKPLKAQRELNRHVGFFIETPDFYNYLTAKQNLQLLQKIRHSKINADTLLDWVGLADTGKKTVGQFSKGMKQRLGIAQALISDPEILILDEPFHGLDPEVKLFLMQRIKDLSKNGKSILISSHLLSDLETLADDFVLLHKGEVQLKGNIAAFKKEQQVVKFYFHQNLTQQMLEQIEDFSFWVDENCISVKVSDEKSAELTQWFCAQNCAPYKIIPENLLHAKYMEITQ